MRIGPGETADRHYDSNRYPDGQPCLKSDRLLAEQEGIEVRIYQRGGCAYANLLYPSEGECRSFVTAATEAILHAATPGDIVFLASLRSHRLTDQFSPRAASIEGLIGWQASPPEIEARRKALEEADTLISLLTAAGLRVVIDEPKPVFATAPFRCTDWFNSKNSGLPRPHHRVPRDGLLALHGQVRASIAELGAKWPSLIVWDPFIILCPNSLCSTASAEGSIFFDGDHLSGLGNRQLFPSFYRIIRTAL